jgi:hypothetical protein
VDAFFDKSAPTFAFSALCLIMALISSSEATVSSRDAAEFVEASDSSALAEAN